MAAQKVQNLAIFSILIFAPWARSYLSLLTRPNNGWPPLFVTRLLERRCAKMLKRHTGRIISWRKRALEVRIEKNN